MTISSLDKNVKESAEIFKRYIYNRLSQSSFGVIQGYLVLNEPDCIIQKKDLKNASCIDENGTFLSFHGSVKNDMEKNEKNQQLIPMLVAYNVSHDLEIEFEKSSVKKFEISIELFPEYLLRNRKFFRYKRTGIDLPYLKVYIEW